MTARISHALLGGLLLLCASPGAPAQSPAVKTTAGEVKRDADLNESGSGGPSTRFTRVPMRRGGVLRDSDWNNGAHAGILTPPLRFLGGGEPLGGSRPVHRSVATAPLSFVGAGRASERVERIGTEKLKFVGTGGRR